MYVYVFSCVHLCVCVFECITVVVWTFFLALQVFLFICYISDFVTLGVSEPICASLCVSCAFYLSNCFSVHSFYFIQVCCFVFIFSY